MTEKAIIEQRLKIAAKMGPTLKSTDFYKRFDGAAELNDDGMFALVPAHEDEDAVATLRRIDKTGDNRVILFTEINDKLYYSEFERVERTPEVYTESIVLDRLTVRSWFILMVELPPEEPMIFTDLDETVFLRETRR